jgi:hypothetical protein
MQNLIFVSVLIVFFSFFLAWGFRYLTREDWQIALAAPSSKVSSQIWTGRNYTYYGVFQGIAFTISSALLCVLVAAMNTDLPPWLPLALIGALAVICYCGAKLLARMVERKKHTFTIGGAFFVGFLAAPWLVLLLNRIAGGSSAIPVMPVLCAGTAVYAIGEGVGRLACISFGCCYGRPVSHLHPLLQRVFRGGAFVFAGKTKKIAYEAGLEGTEVVPIQAITAVFLVSVGLASVALFLTGLYGAGFLLSAIGSQAWRYASETLRADHRGEGQVSAYQVMAAFSIGYAIFLWALFPEVGPIENDVLKGITRLWDPAVVLILQTLGLAVFLFTGRSRVTESSLSFHVREDRV